MRQSALRHLLQFLSLGLGPEEDFLFTRRVYFTNALLLICLGTFSLFFFVNLYIDNFFLLVIDGIAIVSIVVFLFLIFRKRIVTVISIALSLLLLMSVVLIVYSQKNNNFDLAWAFAYYAFIPPMLGARKGTIMVVSLQAIIIPLSFLGIGEWDYGNWSWVSFSKFLLASIFFSIICLLTELSFERSNRQLVRLREAEKEYTTQLKKMSLTDKLTGLHNRHYFDKRMAEELEKISRYNSSSSLIMADIDHFKLVNDTFGHQAGDEVLKQIASRISHHVRKTDILARWGGEEFVILLPDTYGADAKKIANNLRRAIVSEKMDVVGKLSMSFGVFEFDNASLKPEEIIKRADAALYEAKNNGRNCVVLAQKL